MQLPVQLQHHFPQRRIAAGGGIAICQGPERRPALPVPLLEGGLQRDLGELVELRLIPYPQGGVQADEVEIAPQHRGAEGVEGGDIRLGQQLQLPAGPGMALGQRRLQGGGDALAHLGGGGFGEGDDEHAVDIHPILQRQAHDPLHQHRGFAGAGPGGNQDAGVAGRDGALLFSGPLGHGYPSLPGA